MHDLESAQKLANNVRQPAEEARHQMATQKAKLHLKSLEGVKNWTNTILGQRNQRIAAKQNEVRLKEEERQRVDDEWAIVRQEERRDAVNRARLMQYVETSRIRELNARLVMSNVLMERERQLEYKKKMRAMAKQLEPTHEELAAEIRKLDLEDVMKEAKARSGRVEIAKDQREAAERKLAERGLLQKSERDQQCAIDAQIAAEVTRDKKILREIKRLQVEDMRNELDQNIQWKKDVVIKEKAEDDLLTRENQKFNSMKIMLARRKKEVEGGRLRVHQTRCEQLASVNEKLNLEREAKLDAFVHCMTIAHAGEEEARENAKAAWRLREAKEVAKYKDIKLAEIEEQKKAVKEQGFAERNATLTNASAAIKNEERRLTENAKKRVELKEYHFRQMAEVKADKEKKAREEKKMDLSMIEDMEAEDKRFHDYAMEAVAEFDALGKDTAPIIRGLRTLKTFPPVDDVIIHKSDTFERLGFMLRNVPVDAPALDQRRRRK
ncbi:hypothetical protein HK101_002814 [Irineochytrium annulatum]|nr:hypothetical protein HK101_002814 [Irineochytrium annulatum]